MNDQDRLAQLQAERLDNRWWKPPTPERPAPVDGAEAARRRQVLEAEAKAYAGRRHDHERRT